MSFGRLLMNRRVKGESRDGMEFVLVTITDEYPRLTRELHEIGLGGGPVVYADDDGDTAHDFYEANDKGELQKLPRSKLHRCDAKNEIY
ncbi:hypothetical protein FOZ62_029063 [Perkinsus olseni]|uniref:Uncharacterized protein n=1 Tax=Perkinsus olseni TaxID=32597 RepID=A0A7J6UEW9_PEROL|nr:hypothetical protein FOZ62_029063 [Perkinsus olseni]